MQFTEQSLLDAIACPLVVLDVSGDGDPVFSGWNKAAESVSNLSATQTLGRTVAEVFPGRVGRLTADRHNSVVISGAVQSYDATLALPSGERRVRTTLTPLCDSDGTVVRLVATAIDVTQEHRRTLSQVRRVVDVTTIANEMEQFIAMAAHDLRTPMRNVQILADGLRKDFQDLGDGKLELIDLLEDVGIKATSLISDVLAYARTTIGASEAQQFDLADLVEDVAAVIDPQEKHKINCDPVSITTDKTVLQIVVRNLMDNAIKHAARDCITVTVSVQSGPDGQIECQIMDNGKGFEDPTVAFLTGGTFRQGTGFGLLGIKRLILSRCGTITAENLETGSGTVVAFTLPGSVHSTT